MFIVLIALIYGGLLYFHVLKKLLGMLVYMRIAVPVSEKWNKLMAYR
jgi:hypothetical protein